MGKKSNDVSLGIASIGGANRGKLDVSRGAYRNESIDKMGSGEAQNESYGDYVNRKTTAYNKKGGK